MIDNNEQLLELMGHLCNGTLTPELQKQLEDFLIADEDARKLYAEYIRVHLATVDLGRKGEADGSAELSSVQGLSLEYFVNEKSHNKNLAEGSIELSSCDTDMANPAVHFGAWGGLLTAALVTTMAAIFFLAIQLYSPFVPSTKPVVENAGLADHRQKIVRELPNDSLYLAQVVGITPGLEMNEGAIIPEFLLRIKRGDRLEIESGLIELEYYTGARLILHGPCTFVVTSHNSGRLEKGHLTGNVDGGNFLLRTPSARVLDLGTEFGVSVEDSIGTDVCVFDGEVEVFSDYASGESQRSLLLTEGMSTRIKTGGAFDQDSGIDLSQFTREFPDTLSVNENQVSLVDLFSATSEKRFRLAGAIGPGTGKADQNSWHNIDGPGYRMGNVLHETDWHPYVDSVFIPSRIGANTKINSAGDQVDLPDSTGRTWGPIWSRRKILEDAALVSHEDYWGTMTLKKVNDRLRLCDTGMIGIHSNVGVTFDLDAVRRWGGSPTSFTCIVSNLDNSLEKNPEWAKTLRFSADLRVFVNGKLKASRVDFARVDGEKELSVELDDSDRFLTLITSDAGNSRNTDGCDDGFDHVVVIDPVLNLSSDVSSATELK